MHRAGTFSTYKRLRESASTPNARHSQYLIVGPWAHLGINRIKAIGSMKFGSDAIMELNETMIQFLDHQLKDSKNGFGDNGRVRFFVTGENKWRRADDWPTSDVESVKLYLSSSGRANLRSDGGSLRIQLGTAEVAEFDKYRYDPNDPPPFLGSMALYPLPAHTADKSTHKDRKDVLDYRSNALLGSADFVGDVKVVLFVSTDAQDTDFACELFRVTPNGAMYRLTGSIRRLRYHKSYDKSSTVKPSQVVKLVIECPPIGCRLNPGDRLHLQIGSAATPAYAPNLNTREPIATATKSIIAISRVWHTNGHDSYVSLSYLPKAGTARQDMFEQSSAKVQKERSK